MLELERLAVKHEAFGFGQAGAQGLTTHGFDPEGLHAFVREVIELDRKFRTTDQLMKEKIKK
jgi:hypothetical protein